MGISSSEAILMLAGEHRGFLSSVLYTSHMCNCLCLLSVL